MTSAPITLPAGTEWEDLQAEAWKKVTSPVVLETWPTDMAGSTEEVEAGRKILNDLMPRMINAFEIEYEFFLLLWIAYGQRKSRFWVERWRSLLLDHVTEKCNEEGVDEAMRGYFLSIFDHTLSTMVDLLGYGSISLEFLAEGLPADMRSPVLVWLKRPRSSLRKFLEESWEVMAKDHTEQIYHLAKTRLVTVIGIGMGKGPEGAVHAPLREDDVREYGLKIVLSRGVSMAMGKRLFERLIQIWMNGATDVQFAARTNPKLLQLCVNQVRVFRQSLRELASPLN